LRAAEPIPLNDAQFIKDLTRLKELRSFLIEEAAITSALSFGTLNLLRYGSDGREPTLNEWSDVEFHTQELFRHLTEPLRRRFVGGEIPSWFAIKLPVSLLLLALLALISAIVVQDINRAETVTRGSFFLPFYAIWLMALGASGSIAFIGMNALSVQQDITFDLSNRRLILLRIILGALFGLVLTLPFGFLGFVGFVQDLAKGGSLPSVSTYTMLLLLPFVLGFSTSLVIMILNRLVDSVQAFFGKSGALEQTKPTVAASGGQEALTQPMHKRELARESRS
jgi:hypothetical protein